MLQSVVRPAAGDQLGVVGDRITVLHSGGPFEVFTLEGDLDSGPPPHAHPWTERYFVLDGTIEVLEAEQTSLVVAGGSFEIPAGRLHSFRISSPSARMVIVTEGDRVSTFFADVAVNVGPDAPSPDNMGRLIDAARRNGLSSPLFD